MFWTDRRGLGILVAFCLLIGAASLARAADYTEAINQFAADSFADTEAAITGVAGSGNPLAPKVIGALQQGNLLFNAASKQVVIKQGSALIDAATGQPVSEPAASFAPVRLNNRLRRSVEAALGGLTLLSPERRTRLEAAQSVFRSRDAATLPTLETAIAKEQDAEVRQALMGARAAVLLYKSDTGEADKLRRCRSSASATIRRRWHCSRGSRQTHRRLSHAPRKPLSLPFKTALPPGRACRMPGTGFRSVRCCCLRRLGSPSHSA
jgi:hypothetical protein